MNHSFVIKQNLVDNIQKRSSFRENSNPYRCFFCGWEWNCYRHFYWWLVCVRFIFFNQMQHNKSIKVDETRKCLIWDMEWSEGMMTWKFHLLLESIDFFGNLAHWLIDWYKPRNCREEVILLKTNHVDSSSHSKTISHPFTTLSWRCSGIQLSNTKRHFDIFTRRCFEKNWF